MTRLIVRLAAWSGLIAIFLVTISPLDIRPHTAFGPNFERAAAFAVMGALFTIGYPKHFYVHFGLVFTAAFGFEALQIIASGRHANVEDAAMKALGGSAGVVLGHMTGRCFNWAKNLARNN